MDASCSINFFVIGVVWMLNVLDIHALNVKYVYVWIYNKQVSHWQTNTLKVTLLIAKMDRRDIIYNHRETIYVYV